MVTLMNLGFFVVCGYIQTIASKLDLKRSIAENSYFSLKGLILSLQ
jgi:hypothetical protein